MLQTEALEILKTGANCFLTGVPGAGKTYVINKYIEYLEDKGIYPAITASTGIAATHIGGRTIHSFVGIGVVDYLDDYVIDKIMSREKLYKKIESTQVLVIDEISMLDAKVLDKVDTILKAVKKSDKPYGGVQVIFVGDFFQLPPVTKKGEEQKYFAFHSRSWREAKPLTLYLEEQFRQSDEVFTKLLLAIRENQIDEMHVEILEDLRKNAHKKLGLPLESSINYSSQENFFEEASISVEEEIPNSISQKATDQDIVEHDILELHSHNKNVDEINSRRLKKLSGKEFTFSMLAMGRKNLVEALVKSCLSPQELKLKVGAKVIFTKNDLEGKYVNGTMGEVTELSDFSISVKTKDGKHLAVERASWEIEEDGKVKARIEQYPLRLAWAITVHKSQGMSLDEAIVDLGQTFEYGQGYVALSRVRSLEGLLLKNYNPKSLRVNEAVSEFDQKIRESSRFIEEKFQQADKVKLKQTQEKFILQCGGVVEGGQAKISQKEKIEKKSTTETTFDMLESGKSVLDIMKERDLVRGTVYEHLLELYKTEKISKEKLRELTGLNIFDIPGKIKKAFSKWKHIVGEDSKQKLGPVFKELKEKISFDDLKIYREFLKKLK